MAWHNRVVDWIRLGLDEEGGTKYDQRRGGLRTMSCVGQSAHHAILRTVVETSMGVDIY